MARKRKDKWFLAFLLTFVCLVVYYGALLTTRDGVLNSFQLTKHGKMDWSKIQKRPPPPPDSMNDKWIVITTINNPTDDVMKLANIPGWKVVVVGDTKSPKYWRYYWNILCGGGSGGQRFCGSLILVTFLRSF